MSIAARRLQRSGNVNPNDINGVLARRSFDFIDSLGVCTHLGSTSYTNTAEVLGALQTLGIRHIRTNVALNSQLSMRNALSAAGISMHYTTKIGVAVPPTPSVAQIQSAIDARIADVVDNNFQPDTDSIEPFNEYDNSGDVAWDDTLRTVQPYLLSQMNVNLPTSVKTLGPALVGTNLLTKAPQLGNLSASIDYGNLHSYFGGKAPESSYGDQMSSFVPTSVPANDDNFDNRLGIYTYFVSRTKPMVVTEMGYHNDPATLGTGLHKYTSLRAAGIYMPRAYLELFRIGITRSYAYELFNEPSLGDYESAFGFFDNTKSPKPAATAIQQLTTLLDDSTGNAATFTTGKLDYTLVGAPAGLRQVLLQKAVGEFWLAYWQDDDVFFNNGTTATELYPAGSSFTIQFARSRTATPYYDGSNIPSTPLTGTSLTIQSSAIVSLLHIV